MPVGRTPPRERHTAEKTTSHVETNLNSVPKVSSLQNPANQAAINRSEDDMNCKNQNKGSEVGEESQEISSQSQDSEVCEAEALRGLRRNVVGRLDSSVFQPFGPSSRHNSETGSSPDREFVCMGGPGKKCCNEVVKDGQQAVQCDKCLGWYHTACQRVTKPALTALKKIEEIGVCWLCSRCKPNMSVSGNEDSHYKAKLDSLNEKMSDMENTLSQHMTLMEQGLKHQEKNISDQMKLIERAIKMAEIKTQDDQQKQMSLAEIGKGSCSKMVKEVSTKLDSVTQDSVSRGSPGQSCNDVAGILDSFLDKEQRKMNLVVHNMQESPGENARERAKGDAEKLKVMIQESMRLVVRTTKCFRVGKKTDDKPRLLIITLDDLDTKHDILRYARGLQNSDDYGNIYITPDLTKAEREQGRKTREELNRRRNAGEKDLVIWRGKIVRKTHNQGTETRTPPAEANHQQCVCSDQQQTNVDAPSPTVSSKEAPVSEEGATGGEGNQVPISVNKGTGIFGDLAHHSEPAVACGPQIQTPPGAQD